MTIQQIIKQTETLNKEDFQNLFFELLKKANTQYNFKIYVSNYIHDNQPVKKNKQKNINLEHFGSIDLKGSLDNVNIRDYAYE